MLVKNEIENKKKITFYESWINDCIVFKIKVFVLDIAGLFLSVSSFAYVNIVFKG